MTRTFTIAAALAAGVALVGMSGPAWAAGPYSVTTPGASSGTTSVTAATATGSASSPKVLFWTDYVDMDCNDMSATGTANLGSSVSNPIASISSVTFNTCRGPGGLAMNVTKVGTWALEGTAAVSGGKVNGIVKNVKAQVRSAVAGACDFDVEGDAPGYYDNATDTLYLDPAKPGNTLKITYVSGCSGAVVVNDDAYFQADLAISTPTGAITVS